jgi:hypothetical protein
VQGEFFFMAIGGLGVTLAGFAGLIAALERREGGHSPVAAWRIRNVVDHGFVVTFAGFGTVALYAITRDVPITVRLVTVALVLVTAAINRRAMVAGTAWPDERRRQHALVIWLVATAGMLASLVLGSAEVLQLLLLFQLTAPISIFRNSVVDVTRGEEPPSSEA